MPNPTAMIAMGGNSLSPKGEAGTITQQFTHTRETLDGIGHFIEHGYNLCINHGNGPQVGNELLRMDLTHDRAPPLPLGVCVAGTQGSIGYMIQKSLQNKLRDMNVGREVVTLVSQVIVDDNDPSGHLEGLDAVIDKDYAAENMGRIIRAEELWIITDVKYIYRNFGSPAQTPIREITRMETKELYKNGEFQKCSIGPKVRAAMHFLKYHGEKVIITSIPGIKDAFKGNAGTTIRNYA